MRQASRLRPIIDGLALAAMLTMGGWALLRGVESKIASAGADRLSAAAEGTCTIERARLRSLTSVAFDGIVCERPGERVEEIALTGLIVGLAAVPSPWSAVRLSRVDIEGGSVRLGARSAAPDAAGEPEPVMPPVAVPVAEPEEGRIERLGRRFLELEGRIGQDAQRFTAVSRALRPFVDGGLVRVADIVLRDAVGQPLVLGLGGRIDKAAAGPEMTFAAQLVGGGVVSVDLIGDPDGLRHFRARVEDLGLEAAIEQVGAESPLRAGRASAELRWARASPFHLEVKLDDALVGHEFLGEEPLRFPGLSFEGELRAVPEAGALELLSGRWSVLEAGGVLSARLVGLPTQTQVDGGAGAPEPPTERAATTGPSLEVELMANRLALGALLSALPPELIPPAWAEEVQGTMDFSLRFDGPVRDRSAWNLDWDWDFSRMVLAEGRLSREVQGLLEPFEHTFPMRSGGTDRPRRLIGPLDPHFVSLSQISAYLKAAVVTTEDAGFWGHAGFEPTEIKEAVLENLRSGEGRGGSTITQQLAKNLFLSGERTAARKLQEALLSWRLESDLPKERILEIYLNIAEWGPGLYGARDASLHYFGRDPSVLQPEEAAFLASLLPSPVRYHGYYHRPGLTENRRERVTEILDTMLRLGRLTVEEHGKAVLAPVEFAPCP